MSRRRSYQYKSRASRRRAMRASHAKIGISAIKSARRSEAALKGWDYRTRKEGLKQVASGVIDLTQPAISTAISIKDIGIGTAKVISPRKIRRSKTVKRIDVV